MSDHTYILLLRGVNVSGAGKLPMAELRSHLAKAGYEGAKTYIQSGNIILKSQQDRDEVGTRVQTLIDNEFGFRPPVIVLSMRDLECAIQNNPFEVAENKFLHLIFLSENAALYAEGLTSFCTAGEEFHLDGSVFYLATPNGYGRSKAAEKLDKFLTADVKTARNLNSIEKILALAKSL